MDPIIAEQEFLDRLYHWSTQDFEREILQGYPLIRTVNNAEASGFLHCTEQLSQDQQFALATALARRSNLAVLALAGKDVSMYLQTTHEEELLNRYDQFMQWWIREYDSNICKQKTLHTPTDKKALKRLLLKTFADVLGDRITHHSSVEWEYLSEINDWVVCTSFDIGGRFFKHLTISHHIWRSDDPPESNIRSRLHTNYDYLSTLGLSRTYWDISFMKDIDAITSSALLLVTHMMKATHSLTSKVVLSSYD